MTSTTALLLGVLVFVVFAGIGAAIARARGYSAWLGFAVGWTGGLAWLILALLPGPGDAAVGSASGAPTLEFPRVERFLRVAHPLAVGLVVVTYSLSLLILTRPQVARWLDARPLVGGLTSAMGAAASLLLIALWGCSVYLLARDVRLPRGSRGPWTVALIFFNLLAGLFFIPWRWRVLRHAHDPA